MFDYIPIPEGLEASRDFIEASLRSCLIFSTRIKKSNRDTLFQKYVLAILLSGKACTVDEILNEHCSLFGNDNIDKNKIKVALRELSAQNLAKEISPDTWKAMDNGDSRVSDIEHRIKIHVEDAVYQDICRNAQVGILGATVRRNIKECLSYYFHLNGYSFFNAARAKDIEKLPDVDSIASKGIEDRQLTHQILLSLGTMLKYPDDEQKAALDEVANAYLTTQILGIDPLLANFRQGKLREKVFVLDTDIVLNYITENGMFSHEYHRMIEALIEVGCSIYIPSEVISEVYDHGAAACTLYTRHMGQAIENSHDLIEEQLSNVFIRDYYHDHCSDSPVYPNWSSYISNFYDPHFGIGFTRDVIEDCFGKKVYYDTLPPGGTVDERDFELMLEPLFQKTSAQDKGQFRKPWQNEEITKTDINLYLTIRSLNAQGAEKGEAGRQSLPILSHRFYLISTTLKVQRCANKVGIHDHVVCNPLQLLSCLEEAGVMTKTAYGIISLFDNSLLSTLSILLKDELTAIVEAGVQFKGCNVVRMCPNRDEEMHSFMTAESIEDMEKVYDSIRKKDYKLIPYIQTVLDDKQKMAQIIDEKNKEIERANDEKQQMAIRMQKMEEKLNSRHYDNLMEKRKQKKG